MPFINSKISVTVTPEQEVELKRRLGEAIAIIPGKSENWLMTGDNSEPMAFVEVSVFGGEDSQAFSQLTGEITKIFGDVLGIAADHIYVKYAATSNWGWNGSNF